MSIYQETAQLYILAISRIAGSRPKHFNRQITKEYIAAKGWEILPSSAEGYLYPPPEIEELLKPIAEEHNLSLANLYLGLMFWYTGGVMRPYEA